MEETSMSSAHAELPPISHLYQHHRRRALAIAQRILGDSDEAEDVVQDVFSRLCFKPARFDGQAACTTWLYRIRVTSSTNSRRGKRRRGRLEPLENRPLTPEELAVGNEGKASFLSALGEMTEQHRQVLWLRELRGLSYPE